MVKQGVQVSLGDDVRAARSSRAARCGPARALGVEGVGRADRHPRARRRRPVQGARLARGDGHAVPRRRRVSARATEDDGGLVVSHARRADLRPRSRSATRRSRSTPVNDSSSSCAARRAPAELALIRNAVDITVRAQKEAIPAVKAGHERVRAPGAHRVHLPAQRRRPAVVLDDRRLGAELHDAALQRRTTASSAPPTSIVMDIGASYKGYAADVTRTVPASGRFSPEQRAIYQLVRDAQKAAERQATLGDARAPDDRLGERRDRARARAAGPHRVAGRDVRLQHRRARRGSASSSGCTTCTASGTASASRCTIPSSTTTPASSSPGSAFTIEPGIYVRERVLDEIPDTPRNREIAARLRRRGHLLPQHRRPHRGRLHRRREGRGVGVAAPREIAEIEALMKAGSTGPAPRDRALVERYRAP